MPANTTSAPHRLSPSIGGTSAIYSGQVIVGASFVLTRDCAKPPDTATSSTAVEYRRNIRRLSVAGFPQNVRNKSQVTPAAANVATKWGTDEDRNRSFQCSNLSCAHKTRMPPHMGPNPRQLKSDAV